LKALDLTGARLSDEGLVAWANRADVSQLETLNLADSIEVTNIGFAALCRFPLLTSLDISGIERVSDAGVRELGRAKSLRSLTLGRRPLSNATLVELAGLPILEVFEVQNSARDPVDEGIRALTTREALRTLGLQGCCISDSALITFASSHSQLRSLDLADCSMLTDVGVRELASFRSLKKLRLENCKAITDGSVLILATHLLNLASLELASCPNVTDESVVHIAALPNLTFLDLSRTGVADS
jgi:Leucine-rich repeat (LRR) protein